MKIALFLGSDITAQLIAKQVIPKFQALGHEVFVFVPMVNHNSHQIRPLRELYYYERIVWNEYVFPQIANVATEKYFKAQIGNVNSPQFLNFLQRQEIDIAISVRWYQKFNDSLIEYFKNRGITLGLKFNFVNLHPGLLPAYRGVFTFSHSMRNKEHYAGFTLHVIDSNWDAGIILDKKFTALNYQISVLENMLSQVDLAADILLCYIGNMDGPWSPIEQDTKYAGYFSHLKQSEVDQLQMQGIALTGKSEMINFLLRKFWDVNPKKIYFPKFN